MIKNQLYFSAFAGEVFKTNIKYITNFLNIPNMQPTAYPAHLTLGSARGQTIDGPRGGGSWNLIVERYKFIQNQIRIEDGKQAVMKPSDLQLYIDPDQKYGLLLLHYKEINFFDPKVTTVGSLHKKFTDAVEKYDEYFAAHKSKPGHLILDTYSKDNYHPHVTIGKIDGADLESFKRYFAANKERIFNTYRANLKPFTVFDLELQYKGFNGQSIVQHEDCREQYKIGQHDFGVKKYYKTSDNDVRIELDQWQVGNFSKFLESLDIRDFITNYDSVLLKLTDLVKINGVVKNLYFKRDSAPDLVEYNSTGMIDGIKTYDSSKSKISKIDIEESKDADIYDPVDISPAEARLYLPQPDFSANSQQIESKDEITIENFITIKGEKVGISMSEQELKLYFEEGQDSIKQSVAWKLISDSISYSYDADADTIALSGCDSNELHNYEAMLAIDLL